MSVVPAYRLGEVVWAKVTGYPRWPAVIAAIEPERDSIFGEGVDDDTIVFRVNFLAHPSQYVIIHLAPT